LLLPLRLAAVERLDREREVVLRFVPLLDARVPLRAAVVLAPVDFLGRGALATRR
jgi:hypothetical protein